MTDPEHFLSRWSRKKRNAVDEPIPASPAEETAAGESPPVKATDKPHDKQVATSPLSEPVFDPASLPSVDSIGAQTDIRGFLQPGVPPDLARAALRRAWTADPAIRDFKGLQENDWDFNDPKSMFGFGELDPDFDIKRMLASVFGETPKETTALSTAADVNRELSPPADELAATDDRETPVNVESLPAVSDGSAAVGERASAPPRNPITDEVKIVQRNTNAALQDDDSNLPKKADRHTRSHGGALPR